MFATTFNDYQNAVIVENNEQPEIREQERSKLVSQWTETLSNIPGFRGKQLRRALDCGWC